MNRASQIATAASVLVVAGLIALAIPALTAWSQTPTGPATVEPASEPTTTPTPDYITELPEWALVSSPWLIYPDGFECFGTEGCPNDFRALIGEPGPVLPDGVEYYDPEVHDWDSGTDKAMVRPAEAGDGPTSACAWEDWTTQPVDTGAVYGATGTAGLGDDGLVATYTVAANDSIVAIGDRFCIDYATIGGFNGGDLGMIHPGQVLNLRD